MIEIRDVRTDAEELASLEIYNAVWPIAAITIDEARAFRRSLATSFDVLAIEDGAMVGSAAGGVRSQRRDRVFALPTVLAECRRRGAGSALYRHISDWARNEGVEQLETWVEEDEAEGLDFARSRGFSEIERDSRLVLELGPVEPSDPEPPAGVEIVTWAERPELSRGIYEVAREGYPDIPGSEEEEMLPFEDWLEHDMGGPSDRADATFVAVAEDGVVGYAKLSLTNARPTIASHDMTAVKRSWRGRGIARALKLAEIAWAKQQGYELMQTTNEVRNEPMRRVNQRLGYRLAPGRIFLLGPLSGDA